MGFLGIHITNQGIALSAEQVITEQPFLGQLFEVCKGYTPVFYDLDSSVSSLLFLLTISKEQGQKLLGKEKLWIPPYSLTYFPKHFFSIDYSGGGKNHPFLNFAHMNQPGYHDAYYTSDNSLDDAIKKAKQAEATANDVYSILCELGLPNTNLVSPSSTFLKKFSLGWPTLDDCPEEVSELAWRGIMGQWFEAYKLGFFEETYDYDLNASYLAQLSKLPDLRKGNWIQSKTPPDEATLGIVEGLLSTEAEFHPFIIKHNKTNYTPTGRFPVILTLQSLRFLKRWNLGTFQSSKAHWWIPQKNNYEIYKGAMMFLWNARQGTSGRKRLLIQRIYSSLVGKQLEYSDTKGFGDMFCPIIPLTVEANSRLQVAKACLQAGITPLAVMADGFISEQPTKLALSTELGGWRLSAQGKCIIAGTGMVAFQGKEPPAELALNYDSLRKQIERHPDATKYSRNAYSPVTLALALQQDWSKLGQVQKIERTLTIGTENKRMYLQKPHTGKDLLDKTWDSMPWDYEELTMLHPASQRHACMTKGNLTSFAEVEAELGID